MVSFGNFISKGFRGFGVSRLGLYLYVYSKYLYLIYKKTISIVSKREGKPNTKTCSEADWNNLMKVLKTVDVENIPSLKAPSEDRFFDGAAIGNLKITYNGTVYESQSFDHGNPPKEIATLVKEILSISENIE